jgi:tetratricopeptide (TPR) repeat protein
MATKHKQRARRGAAGLFQEALRSLQKGDFKQALKDAKVCYRQQPSPEGRSLLERAYLARGRQLCRAGLRVEARATVEALLELRVTDASVQQDLPELLIALGLFNRVGTAGGAGASLEEGGSLYATAADHAVLRPEQVPASLPAIRQGAGIVRQALAALEAGDETLSLAVLKDIPRASPFADWKYFVRGLAAYYRRDAAETQANWERLDAGRFASRIAAPLKVLADPGAVPADDFGMADAVARLGTEALGGPILVRVQQLQEHLIAGRWREAVRLLRVSGAVLRQFDSALPQRLGMVLYATFVRKGASAALRELASVAEPPPIDPHWNRGRAMAGEHAEDDDPSEVERCWRAYLDDLAGLECLLPAERTLAQALVWLRLGRHLVEESCPLCSTCGVRHEPDEQAQARAVACFEESLKLAPELLSAYQALAEAFGEWEKPEQAAATHRRLVQRFPEDLESLLFLATHYVQRDEPLAARDFVFRAQRLKPLDPQIKAMAWFVHVAGARHHALAGRWDAGRAELAAAEKMGGPHAPIQDVLVPRAALEFKAGEYGLGHRLLDRARNELGEAAPVWLLMTIEGIRYALPKAVTGDFEHRWQTALKKDRHGPAAGEMCRILLAHAATDVPYPGCEKHVGRLLDFLRHCSRIKWQAHDLRRVLEFLVIWAHHEEEEEHEKAGPSENSASSGAGDLLANYAAKARKKFPEVAFFQYLAGELEMRKGPWKCDRRFARECFRRTVQLAEGAGDSDSIDLAKRAEKKAHLLEEFETQHLDAGPRFPLPFPAADGDDRDEEAEDTSGVDEDADEDRGGEGFSPTDTPAKLFAMFARLCRSEGLDPEKVLDRAARGMPLRFRRNDDPKPARKKRK